MKCPLEQGCTKPPESHRHANVTALQSELGQSENHIELVMRHCVKLRVAAAPVPNLAEELELSLAVVDRPSWDTLVLACTRFIAKAAQTGATSPSTREAKAEVRLAFASGNERRPNEASKASGQEVSSFLKTARHRRIPLVDALLLTLRDAHASLLLPMLGLIGVCFSNMGADRPCNGVLAGCVRHRLPHTTTAPLTDPGKFLPWASDLDHVGLFAAAWPR